MMELNIKVWKPVPKLKSQQRQFLMVNDQWLIDNADLLRNGGFEIDETFEAKIEPVKEIEIEKENLDDSIEVDQSEKTKTPLFDFDKTEEKPKYEKTVKTKISKK